MNRVLLPLLALLVLASIALPNTAQAYLITVNFTVSHNASDPIYGGIPINGSFSFDSSEMPFPLPGVASHPPNGLILTSLDLLIAGHPYTDADAGLIDVSFDAAGKVVGWTLGGRTGGLNSISGNTNDFVLGSAGDPSAFSYTYLGSGGPIWDVTELTSWSVTYGTDQAPEPGSLALFAPALLALGLIRKRRG